MKATVTSSKLRAALRAISPAIGTRMTLKVLKCVLLSAQESGKITVEATNLDLRLSAETTGTVFAQGCAVIPHAILSEAADSLGEEIDVEVAGLTLALRGKLGAVKCLLHHHADDFPPPHKFREEAENGCTLPSSFFPALRRISFCMSKDETRFILCGALLREKQGGLMFVATDGRRLSEEKIEGGSASDRFSAILPAGTVEAMVLLSENGAETVGDCKVDAGHTAWSRLLLRCSVSSRESSVAKEDGESETEEVLVRVESKLVEGSYPNYEQVIPAEDKLKATFSLNELRDAIKACAGFIEVKDPTVKLRYLPSESRFQVSTKRDDCHANASVRCTTTHSVSKGGKFELIAFNPDFLLEALGVLKGDSVELGLTDEVTPVVIRSDEAPHWLHVLMPKRIVN